MGASKLANIHLRDWRNGRLIKERSTKQGTQTQFHRSKLCFTYLIQKRWVRVLLKYIQNVALFDVHAPGDELRNKASYSLHPHLFEYNQQDNGGGDIALDLALSTTEENKFKLVLIISLGWAFRITIIEVNRNGWEGHFPSTRSSFMGSMVTDGRPKHQHVSLHHSAQISLQLRPNRFLFFYVFLCKSILQVSP